MNNVQKLSQLNVPDKEKKALRQLKLRLKERLGEHLLMLKLHGSKARGNWHKESDIDVFIVVKNKSDIKQAERIAFDVGRDIDVYNISPLIYSQKEYQEMKSWPTLFVQFVENEGIDI